VENLEKLMKRWNRWQLFDNGKPSCGNGFKEEAFKVNSQKLRIRPKSYAFSMALNLEIHLQ